MRYGNGLITMTASVCENTLLINDAIYWRGLFIHRYAGIEYALADLLVRASQIAPYNMLGELPFHHNKRLKRIREVMEMDGPWKQWEGELGSWISEFEILEETRHFLAHGIMGNDPKGRQPEALLFRMYDYKGKPALLHDGFFKVTLRELKEYAERVRPLSTGFVQLCSVIAKKFPKLANAIPD